MNRGNVLVIDDEEKLRHLLKRIISAEGFSIYSAGTLEEADRLLKHESIDVILCDVNLPDGNGVDFIQKVKAKHPFIEIIMFTGFGNFPAGVQSIKNGAFDYLIKGDDNERILPLLDKAVENIRKQKRGDQLKKNERQYVFENILGESEYIKMAIELAKKVAPTDATVLLLGETGTGKEVFAQAIHHGSRRTDKLFIALNVSSFNKELLESELFGHLAGAFTGAAKDKKGLIEEADGGTLFLDEIGEMAFDLQAKLLRVIETSEFIKVGGTKSTKVNVRIITATNRDLQEEVNQGRFREDLFYRLNTFTIELPSLNARITDIPLLAEHFLHHYALKINEGVKTMSNAFMQKLLDHEWKGNIRELKNVIERAVILATGSELTVSNLPLSFQNAEQKGNTLSAFELSSMEKLHIQRVLNHTHGNKMAAARLLNIGLTTLYRKIEEFKLA
jgi:two-component system, NtrC family, response regulator